MRTRVWPICSASTGRDRRPALRRPRALRDALVVAAFGGKHGETLQKCVIQPFIDKTGIKVTVDQGVSTITVSKLKQQKGNPRSTWSGSMARSPRSRKQKACSPISTLRRCRTSPT